MRWLFFVNIIIFIFSGCVKGSFSIKDGSARFTIPFDFPYNKGEGK